jgi:hypothetical protein
VLAIGGDVVVMNPYLRRTLNGNDQTMVLEHASDLLSSTLSGTAPAVLPSGHIAKITATDRSTMPSPRRKLTQLEALQDNGGNQQEAARALGRSLVRRSCETLPGGNLSARGLISANHADTEGFLIWLQLSACWMDCFHARNRA